MNFNRSLFLSNTDNWATPKDVYNTLDNEFNFNDDPCPLGGNGGLNRDWGTRTFVNPPYSQISDWVEYAFNQSLKGKLIVMLIPSRTDTRWWHNFVMKADQIRFIKGRLKFGGSKNSAVIVGYFLAIFCQIIIFPLFGIYINLQKNLKLMGGVIMMDKLKNKRLSEKSDYFMSLKEAAEYLRVHRITLYRLAKKGGIKCFKVGSQYRFKKEWMC